MRKKAPMQEVDPLALPLGTRVGPWRVTGFRGRGSYGTLYRAEREGREEEGPCALKLAVYPGDERFKREAWLLRHIHSPFVPRFLGEGGPGPRAPSELNLRVSGELDALILRLLARAPDERFEGRAWEAAEALEQAWRSAGT